MKTFKHLLMALLLLCSVVASAHDFEVDGIYYNLINPGTVEVTYNGSSSSSNAYSGDIVIPSSITYNGNTYNVTSIGSSAFWHCTGLTGIEIPNSVTSIGDEAFYGCTGLTGIEIPNSVTSIEGYAFADCTGLTSIEIPNSVTSIGNSAFSGCSGLISIVVDGYNTKYDSRESCNAIIETETNTLIFGYENTTIPNSVTSIGSSAFANCTGLTSIEIPNSVTSIGDAAFLGCTGLTGIEIPNSVTSIGSNAFSDCTGLTSVVIPDSVTSIGFGAFANCTGLTSVVIGNSVTSIGSYAFSGCTGLTGIEIPNSVTSIRSKAFSGCTGLTGIVIPNSVTSIGEYAFEGCTGLTGIEIPDSVTSIEKYAFSGCTGLTSIVIPNSVTSIGEYAFKGCTGLTGIVIPNSVTSIEKYTFSGCIGLTGIVIPNSVKSIGSSAFADCTGLTSVVIGNSVISIGSSAFYGCSGLKTVINFSKLTFSKGSTSYGYIAYYAAQIYRSYDCSIEGDYVFVNSSGVNTLVVYLGNAKELILPATCNGKSYVIGENAFSGCTGLTSIVVDENNIKYDSRESCNAIIETETNTLILGCKNTTIPNSVTSIGRSAFTGCTGLTGIEIPNSVTSIGDEAFYGCTGLTGIEIPNSVTSIGDEAFNGCTGLTNIEFLGCIETGIGALEGTAWYSNQPDGVVYAGATLYKYKGTVPANTSIYVNEGTKKINNNAFSGCTGLTGIVIPNSVTSIGDNAFSGCTGLTGIVIPNSVTSIGNYAFSGCTGLTRIIIPNSVTSILDSAFEGCTGLKTIINFSNLTFSKGSSSNGYIAYYADKVIDATGAEFIGDFLFCKSNGTNILCTYIGNETHLILPESYNGENYVIGDNAFSGCTGLTSIEIPNSVTIIGSNAFSGCAGLTSVEIGNGVTSLEQGAFARCPSLTNVVIGNSVTSIGEKAFYDCSGLTGIVIPNSVTSIGYSAFSGCSGLTSIVIPNSVTNIRGSVFNNCSALESIVVEDGNTVYNSHDNCNAIIETKSNTLLYGCKNTVIPNSITSIRYYAFFGCTGLTNVDIPDNVATIGHGAFYGCTGLTNVDIPDNVVTIEPEAFYGCSNLSKLSLGSGLCNIGYYAFGGCGLTEVTSKAISAPNYEEYAFSSENKIPLIFPEGANYIRWSKDFTSPYFEFYECYDDWDSYTEWYVDQHNGHAIAVGYNGAKINDVPFGGYSSIKTLHIEGDVVEVNSAPGGLEEVYMPNSVLKIGDNAFRESNIKSITLPLNLTTIGEYAFAGAPLEFVVIPSQVTSIGYDAFAGGYDYENDIWLDAPVIVFKSFVAPTMAGFGSNPEICVPVGANSYPSGKFSNIYYYESQQECCIKYDWNSDNYKMFVFGNADGIYADSEINGVDIKEVNKVTFASDATGYNLLPLLPNVKNVDVLKSNLEDGKLYSKDGANAVFQYRSNESSETILVAGCATTVIPEGTTAIEDNAFNSCVWLKNINIPSSVKRIGQGAFYGCSGLTNVTTPYGVEIFSSEVFAYCRGLKSVVINGRIGGGTFYNCTGLTDITVGKMASDIDGNDFYGCKALTNITVDKECLLYDDRDNCNAIIEKASNKLILASKKTVIPNSVTSISGDAFHAHADMDLTVPKTVESIDARAFYGVNKLYFESETPATIPGDVFGWGAIYVPASAYETYCNANVWSNYEKRIVTTEIADKSVEVYSTEGMSGVLDAIGLNEVDKVVKLKVKGEINSYDIIVFRDKMPLLNDLDLSEATVIASRKPFYQTYCTGKNSLGGYAFYDLDKLICVKLPKELKVFGDYAFYGCDKLTTVDASQTDEINIGVSAFERCSKLENFVSPQKIGNINGYAFKSCNKLENIELRNISGSIGENAFYGANIKNVDIDSIGGNIETYAFKECSNLQNVSIGAMAGSLGNNAFAYCTSLKNVEFKKGPARIGSEVFECSDSLVNFVAGEGVEEVSDYAFRACKYVRNSWGALEKHIIPRPELKKVVLPNSVQRIGKETFYQCTSLSDFVIPQNATNIGESAFGGCSSLKSVNIPEGTTSIKLYAFRGCSSLKNITFPSGLTSIGDGAFSNCAFENLKLPPRLKTIGKYAFNSCYNLTELHIPSAVENIADGAFAGCYKLNDVYTYTIEPTTITETTFSTFGTARLHVPMTSFWNYYWNIGWSRFDHKLFVDFNEPYDYFYLNNDYYLNGENGYIEGNPDADMRPGSGLIVSGKENDGEDAKQNLGNVNVESDGEGNSASIIGDENLHIDNLNVKINVKGGRWYFFAFPWDVKLDRISMQDGSDYVFRYYDGEERAKKGNGGWKDVHEPHLKAARGYIFQCSADDVLVLSIEDVKFKKTDKYNELVTHASENLNDASWNLMGNPYLSYYDMAEMDYTAPVTVWDGSKYVAIRPGDDDYQFTPYEAFFVQKPEGQENVVFGADGQFTKTEGETAMQQKAAARRVRGIDPQRLLVNLVLTDDVTEDRTRVVFNERRTHNYETACDAAKFETAGVPQLYTMDDEGVRYAINERPVGNGVVLMGYTAPTPGRYTIDAPRMDTQVFLYDAETGEKHYFEDGAYSFSSEAGTFEKRFSLGIRGDETTGIEEMEEENGNVTGESGKVKTIYDLHGRKLNRTGKGVYIINGEKVVK